MHDDLFRGLYPTLSDEELAIAKENLIRYLEIAWGIMEDLEATEDPP
jgi:hypothetical protein